MDFITQLTEEEINYGWFQQDSATVHTANRSMIHLHVLFGEQIISTGF